jgi:hypothetical protein
MIDQQVVDAIGYVAAGLVLASFCMQSVTALRWAAIASNVAFIIYGYLGEYAPVLLLHVLLFPVNSYRLRQLYLAGRLTRSGTRIGGGKAGDRRPASTAALPRQSGQQTDLGGAAASARRRHDVVAHAAGTAATVADAGVAGNWRARDL